MTTFPPIAPTPTPPKPKNKALDALRTAVITIAIVAAVFLIAAFITGSFKTTATTAKTPTVTAQAATDGDLSTYKVINDRTWALVAKDPEGHVGEKYVIYGKVTQFDSATGTSTFRANTGGTQQEQSYNYDVNTMISAADPAKVADIVADDLVKMYVRVTGALTYETTMGGSTTVPQTVINSHVLLGHDK